jgi:hypothetical protein
MPITAPTGAATGRIVPNALAITEWYSKIDGTIEACGQASVAMALHALNPGKYPATSAFVTQLATETTNAKETTDWPHASTSARNLQWLFKQHGYSATIHYAGDYRTTVQAFAGVKPLCVGVSNATAFGGHDAHVNGHWVTIFGVNPKGVYIVGDPNTSEATSGAFVFYSPAQLAAAEPFAVLVPNQDPLASIPLIGGALDSLIAPVNQTMLHVNGFSGIVGAIAADEHVSQPNLSSMLDLPGWVFSNMRAWLIRAIVIGVGLLLILAVLIQTIKTVDPDFWQMMSTPASGGGPQLAQALTGAAPGVGGGVGGAAAGATGGAGIPVELAALA